jgi:hypothetical protein
VSFVRDGLSHLGIDATLIDKGEILPVPAHNVVVAAVIGCRSLTAIYPLLGDESLVAKWSEAAFDLDRRTFGGGPASFELRHTSKSASMGPPSLATGSSIQPSQTRVTNASQPTTILPDHTDDDMHGCSLSDAPMRLICG